MVLCPYVFLITRCDSPMLKLQPTEVASTHWVSLRALLSPNLRTVEHVDVSERFARRSVFVPRLLYRSLMGLMQFSAIRLVPTESTHCSSIPGFIPEPATQARTPPLFRAWKTWCLSEQADSNHQTGPLLLWGLTLGILADFLDMLPPHTAVRLWRYPTFTPPDLRLIVSILTYRLRKRNVLRVKSGLRPHETAADSTTVASLVTLQKNLGHDHNEVGIDGLGVGKYHGPSGADGTEYAVGIMLRGYYDRLRVAVWVFLAWRLAAGSIGGFYLWRFLRRRCFSR